MRSLVPSQKAFLRRIEAAQGSLELRRPNEVRSARALKQMGLIQKKSQNRHMNEGLEAGDTIKLTDYGQRYLNSERWSKFCRP